KVKYVVHCLYSRTLARPAVYSPWSVPLFSGVTHLRGATVTGATATKRYVEQPSTEPPSSLVGCTVRTDLANHCGCRPLGCVPGQSCHHRCRRRRGRRPRTSHCSTRRLGHLAERWTGCHVQVPERTGQQTPVEAQCLQKRRQFESARSNRTDLGHLHP